MCACVCVCACVNRDDSKKRETVVNQNWNKACAALRSFAHVRAGRFVGAGRFADEVAAELAKAKAEAAEAAAAAAEEAAANGTDNNVTTVSDTTTTDDNATDASAADGTSPPPPVPPSSPPPPFSPSSPPEPPITPPPPLVTDPMDPDFNVTRGIVSVCALLRLDARAHSHLLGMVVGSGIHPFAAGEVRESCVLVTGTTECRGASYAVPAMDLTDEGDENGDGSDAAGGAGLGRRRSEL